MEIIIMMVDFQVTSRCHLDCKYCFDILKGTREKEIPELKNALRKLSEAGVDSVCITGGEPLLRKDIEEVISEAQNQFDFVYLSTQGNFIDSLSERAIRNLDCIGLPLDTINEEQNKSVGRPINQKEIFLHSCERILSINPSCAIKVGTVFSELTRIGLKDTAKFLSQLPFNFVWRIYEFNPIGNGEVNQAMLSVSTDVFNQEVGEIINDFPSLEISPMRVADSENGYFFVGPAMDLLYFGTEDFVKIGEMDDLSPLEIKSALFDTFSTIKSKINNNRKWVKRNDQTF